MSLSDEINEVLESEQNEQFKKKFAKKLFFRDENGNVYELCKGGMCNWSDLISDLFNNDGSDTLKRWSEHMFKRDVTIYDFDCEGDFEEAFEELIESCNRKADAVLEKLIDRESLKLTELGAKFIRNIPSVLDRIDPDTSIAHWIASDITNDQIIEILKELGVVEACQDCEKKINSAFKHLKESISWFNQDMFLGIKPLDIPHIKIPTVLWTRWEYSLSGLAWIVDSDLFLKKSGGVNHDISTAAKSPLKSVPELTTTKLPVLLEQVFGKTKYLKDSHGIISQAFCSAYMTIKFQSFFIFCSEKLSTIKSKGE